MRLIVPVFVLQDWNAKKCMSVVLIIEEMKQTRKTLNILLQTHWCTDEDLHSCLIYLKNPPAAQFYWQWEVLQTPHKTVYFLMVQHLTGVCNLPVWVCSHRCTALTRGSSCFCCNGDQVGAKKPVISARWLWSPSVCFTRLMSFTRFHHH